MSTFFNIGKLRTIAPALHFLNCVNIGRSHAIEAAINGLSKFPVENV